MKKNTSGDINVKALHASTFSYTYSKIMYNSQGMPIDFLILDANNAFAQLMQKEKSEVIHKRVTSLFPELRATDLKWLEKYARVASTENPEEYEWYSSTLDKWFHLSITCPKKGYIIILSIDITRRVKAENELHNREEMNRAYFDNTPDGIIVVDNVGRIIKTNPSITKFINKENKKTLGNTIEDSFEIVEPYDFATIINEIQDAPRYQRIIHLIANNSAKTIVEDIVKFPTDKFLIVWRDISIEIKNRMDKELYFEIYNKIAQPTLVCDSDSTIITVNDSFTKMCGYSERDISGRRINEIYCNDISFQNFGLLQSFSPDEYHTLLSRASNPQYRYSEIEVVLKTKDNLFIQSYMVIVGLFDNNEKLTNLLFFPVDISNRRNLEEQIRVDLYRTIAELAELRDDETGNHMRRIGIFASMLAKQLNMNEKFCHDIDKFAPLHDIGKVGIADSILLKKAQLTPEEFDIMKTHTTLGYNIVKNKARMEMVAEITLNHHERFDGSGYPNGISGYDIPLSAQITAIVDIYDALRSVRPYKQPWSHEKVVDHIKLCYGKLFSPEITDAFLSIEKDVAGVYQDLNKDKSIR